jgi:Uma2 family endonuclease
LRFNLGKRNAIDCNTGKKSVQSSDRLETPLFSKKDIIDLITTIAVYKFTHLSRQEAMTTLLTNKLTFEDYLTYDDGTDNQYELEDGVLILMNPPIGLHTLIIRFLSHHFESEIQRSGLPWAALQMVGVRTAPRRSRLPDLCIVPVEVVRDYLDTSAVIESGALLAIELVSPESIKRDYRFKRAEYAAFGIPEYWIVDPMEQKVTVLLLVEGLYEETIYCNDDLIASQTFPDLKLTVNQILNQ